MKKQTLTITELTAAISKAAMELSMHKSKNTNLVKYLRRDLARAKTAKRQEELNAKA
ncbi:50S ribosomal protein L29 [Candidatus Microgenomates bacterium]|nr:50S ribosomal protein L29 [Candidatus Microgenomates bacterium]